MSTLKKHTFLVLALFFTLPLYSTEQRRNSFRKTTKELAVSTIQDAEGALCAIAQGADHLMYPALCFALGRAAWTNKHVSSRLRNAPDSLTDFEKNRVPGGDLARTALTYVVIGGALCAGLNYLSDIEQVDSFLQKNMPHLSALLQHIKTELSYNNSTRSKK